MDGEIITSAEQRKASDLADVVRQVIAVNHGLTASLAPVRDFLDTLAWKGSH